MSTITPLNRLVEIGQPTGYDSTSEATPSQQLLSLVIAKSGDSSVTLDRIVIGNHRFAGLAWATKEWLRARMMDTDLNMVELPKRGKVHNGYALILDAANAKAVR